MRWTLGFTPACILLSALLAVAPGDARAQSEDQIKAAFLFNFARYVEWPDHAFDGPTAPVKICMMGSGGFLDVVSKIVAGKTVAERSVEVLAPRDLASASDCHILFLAENQTVSDSTILGALGNSSVFTISDRDGFAESGGIANFVLVDNKVRFEINPVAAKTAGLKVSSRLLRLASVVE